MRTHALTLSLLLALAGLTRADDTPAKVTRADLARSYQRFERLRGAAGQLAPERLAQLNRAFDRATVAFFGGNGGAALRQIDALSDELCQDAILDAQRYALRADPPRWVRGQAPQARLVALYPPSADARDVSLTLVVHGPGEQVARRRLVAAAAPAHALDGAALAQLPVGNYWVGLALGSGAEVEVGRFSVLARSLDELRAELSRELEAAPPSPSREVARGRLVLLTDRPSVDDTAQLLVDPFALVRELRAEVEALKAGRDPYRARSGDC